MKKTSILSAILAGSLMVFGGFGCSHDDQPPAGPSSVSGQATPTTGDQTTTPQPTSGDQTTQPSTAGSTTTTPGYQSTTPNSGYQPTTPKLRVDRISGSQWKGTTMPNSPSDTTKPDTTNPDTTNPPSTTPPK